MTQCEPKDALASGLGQAHLPMLDGLRAIAVSLVILGHSGLPSPAGLGVLIFFVISGFLITWLLLAEDHRTGSISLKNFYARRSLRIFPAFYSYSAILLATLLIRHKPILWPQAIAALLYFNNYYQAIVGDPNTGFSHTWSLAVEEQFYLLWPAVFLIWKDRLPRLRTVLITIIVAVWLYRAVLQFVVHVNQGYLYEAFDARADHLLIGCLLAVFLWSRRFNPRLDTVSGLWQLCLTAGLLSISALAEQRYAATYRDSIGFLVNPLLAALLIVQTIACRQRCIVAWMQTPAVRYIGRISYSLYLYQQLVLPVVEHGLHAFLLPVRVGTAIVCTVAAASASFYFIERPALRWKTCFSSVAFGTKSG